MSDRQKTVVRTWRVRSISLTASPLDDLCSPRMDRSLETNLALFRRSDRKEAQMRSSAEIEKLIRDTVAAYERGDLSLAERTTSKQPGTVSIGTASHEYVRDHEPIVNSIRAEITDSPNYHVRIGEIHAYEHGDVGWADGTGYLEKEGQSVPIRSTSVFLRESGEWRSVQGHSSIGVPNDHMFDAVFRARATAS